MVDQPAFLCKLLHILFTMCTLLHFMPMRKRPVTACRAAAVGASAPWIWRALTLPEHRASAARLPARAGQKLQGGLFPLPFAARTVGGT